MCVCARDTDLFAESLISEDENAFYQYYRPWFNLHRERETHTHTWTPTRACARTCTCTHIHTEGWQLAIFRVQPNAIEINKSFERLAHLYTHTRMHTQMHMRARVCTHTHIHTYTHTHHQPFSLPLPLSYSICLSLARAHTRTHTCVCVCVCVHVYACVAGCGCVYRDPKRFIFLAEMCGKVVHWAFHCMTLYVAVCCSVL